MAARVGPAPWSEGYRRSTAADRKRQNVEWSITSGYRQRDEWDRNPTKPKMRTVTLRNGRKVQVPEDDFEDFIGFSAPRDEHGQPKISDPYSAVSQYIDEAFDNTRANAYDEIDGVGHIEEIAYSARRQLLRVVFANDGAIVVFFRVPPAVYGELYYLAKSGSMAISAVDGQQRHVLGMRFWDIVRIRGQREGSRYKYEYTQEGIRETAATREAAAEDKATKDLGEAKITATATEIYDRLARNLLIGNQLDAYNKLSTEAAKAAYLKKAGIL